jgi:hypothetical protein
VSAGFPPSSRYYGVGLATIVDEDGDKIVYLRRRIVPAPERFATIDEHSVVEGDRVDTIAATYLEDPEKYWLLCDANGVLRPGELVREVGERVRITLPEGIEGAKRA